MIGKNRKRGTRKPQTLKEYQRSIFSHIPKKVIIEAGESCNVKEFNDWYNMMKQQNHITDEEVCKHCGIDRTRLYRMRSGKQKIDPLTAAGLYTLFDYRQEYTVEEFLHKMGVYNYWDLSDDGKPTYEHRESYWD